MGITEFGYGETSQRKRSYFRDVKDSSIIDIGGGKEKHIEDKFSFTTAIVDILPEPSELHGKIFWFQGDVNMPDVWDEILGHVRLHGKFEHAICTHTLEDLRNPLLTAKMLPLIAKRGLVTFPSVDAESRRFEWFGLYRGWRHHRWVHLMQNIDDEVRVMALPKTGTFELPQVGRLASRKKNRQELWFTWDEGFTYELFQNDHLGPDQWTYTENYLATLLGTKNLGLAGLIRKVHGQLLSMSSKLRASSTTKNSH